MKTAFILAVFLVSLGQCSFAQKISKKEARQILEKTLGYLKTNDTASFVNLWHFDATPRPFNGSFYSRTNAVEEFIELKSFLDTALIKNLPFDEIEVEKMPSFKKYKIKYKIKGWFKYDNKKQYYKGYGFLIDHMDGRWGFRFTAEQSTSYRN